MSTIIRELIAEPLDLHFGNLSRLQPAPKTLR